MKQVKFILLFCFILPFYAYSGVRIGGTRVIYNEKDKQATVTVINPDKRPYLIQSWIEGGKEKQQQDFFIMIPPLFRLEAESRNIIKIFNVNPLKKTDRETFFWLDIKAIPSSDKNATNTLRISVKNRMKLFFRPKGLTGNPGAAYKKVQFSMEGKHLGIYNPTPYYITFNKLAVNGKEIKLDLSMIAPFQKLSIVKFNAAPPPQKQKVVWQAISDYGGTTREQETTLN